MDKGFEFIDSTRHDRLSRRLARSHAMKGKNAGRKLNRRSKFGPDRLSTGRQTASLHNDVRNCIDRDVGGRRSAVAQSSLGMAYDCFSNQLFSVGLPIEISSHCRYVIKEFWEVAFEALYPPTLCRSLDKVKSYWTQVFLIDKPSCHCSIALMASLTAFISGKEHLPPKAIYHLNQAVSLINTRLDTSEALSDSSLAIVNFLTFQGLVLEKYTHAKVHLNGLRKMIELRGGLEQLSLNEVLLVKICKTDMDYALHYGTSTCFYRDRMSEVARTLALEGFPLDRSLFQSQSRFSNMDPFLHQILVDVTNICSLFNRKNADFRLDPDMLQEIIVSVGYRLVRFHPLCEAPPENRLEAVCHIGLTAFMTTMFLQFGRRRYLKYGLVAQCATEIIEINLDEGDGDFKLWLLFICGISVLDWAEQAWLASKIRRVAQELGIRDWAALHRCLVKFPWISSMHDEAGKALWDSVSG